MITDYLVLILFAIYINIYISMAVLIETSMGDLVIDLYVKECPNACKNFIKLCK